MNRHGAPVADPVLQEPPHSIEAEQCVLGALLIDNACVGKVESLTQGDFFDHRHRTFYGAIAAMVDTGRFADPVTVVDWLKLRGDAAEQDDMSYLQSLIGSIASTRGIQYYADIIRDKAQRRQLIAVADQTRAAAYGAADANEARLQAQQLIAGAMAASNQRKPAALFEVVDLAATQTPTSAQEWFWAGYVPAGHLTHLGGHGGAGKSTIGLMLGCCVGVGRECLGRPTQRARVCFFSAEDPRDLLLRRLDRIARNLDLDRDDLAAQLHIIDATEFDPVLFAERRVDGLRTGVTTPTYAALAAYVEQHDIEVVIVDNASDTFEGDEINRAMVRAFVRELVRLVRARNGAVLLLAHVDKGTSRAGKTLTNTESYSGSTAWHNSARSRLFLVEKEPGLLELQHQKCNLGPKQPPVDIEWPTDGVPQVLSDAAIGPMQAYLDDGDTAALLQLVGEFYARGEFVSASQYSPANAARVLSGQKSYPKRKPVEVFELLRDAERQRLIARELYRTGDRKERERWALTDLGRSLVDESAPTAPTAPTHGFPTGRAVGAAGAPTAPTCGAGGVGGLARTQRSAQTRSAT